MRFVVMPPKIAAAVALSLLAAPVRASLFQGETLDAVANGIAWVALFIVPIAGIVRLLARPHPSGKDRREAAHPQLDAIKTLCLLSLVFGGLLWPIAWLWAYTSRYCPQQAYGTDKYDKYFLRGPGEAATSSAGRARERLDAIAGCARSSPDLARARAAGGA